MSNYSFTRRAQIIAGLFAAAAVLPSAYIANSYLNPGITPDDAVKAVNSGIHEDAQNYMKGTLDASQPHSSLKRVCSLIEQETKNTFRKAGLETRFSAEYSTYNYFNWTMQVGEKCSLHTNNLPFVTLEDLSDIDSQSEVKDLRQLILKQLPESDIEKLSRMKAPPEVKPSPR